MFFMEGQWALIGSNVIDIMIFDQQMKQSTQSNFRDCCSIRGKTQTTDCFDGWVNSKLCCIKVSLSLQKLVSPYLKY